jgi:hypothetical protein
MNRIIFLAAATLFCALSAGAASVPTKPEEVLADPQPRNPLNPIEPPAQSVPTPLSGKPAPPSAGYEGTGRPVAAKTDTELLRDLTSKLLDDPAAPPIQALTIAVKDGRATLRGVARSPQDKDAATAKAGAIAGLRNVSNLITVER